MPFLSSFIDSFKPAEGHHGHGSASFQHGKDESKFNHDPEKSSADEVDVGPPGYTNADGVVTTERGIRLTTADTALKRNLSTRHMQMIAIGGAIGTGLFIGSGNAFATGGPASVMIDFILMGVLLAATVMALGELATTLPVAGSFAAYATRFIDPAWGFAMGWNYWMQWFVVFPLELVAASIVIRYWDPNGNITPGVWVVIFIVCISIINLFGVRGYGEFEVVSSMVKVLACVGFIFVGIVIQTGGSPSGRYLGAETWQNGQAFQGGFKGFCSVFVTAAFAYAGTELVGLAAAESQNPRKEVPKASKQVFWRIMIFYIVNLFIISLIVPSSDPALTSGSSSYDAQASPFVIAIRIGGIQVLPSIFNAVILISVLSVGNSAVYAASRTLCALSQQGLAPKAFSYIDRAGRPIPAVLLSLAFGPLAFLIYSTSQSTVFGWLLSLSGLSSLYTWGTICAAHIRFRAAWKHQGRSLEELPWTSPLGVWGSWVGLFLAVLAIVATFYTAAFPIGEGELTPSERASGFFQSFLTTPIIIAFYLIGVCFVKGRGWIPLSQLDVTTGRREGLSLEQLREERAALKARPLWKRILSALF